MKDMLIAAYLKEKYAVQLTLDRIYREILTNHGFFLYAATRNPAHTALRAVILTILTL